MKALSNQEIDLGITDKIVGLEIIYQLELNEKIIIASDLLYSKPYYTVFSRKSNYPNKNEIMIEFYKELSRMKKSGEFQEIYDKYIGVENE